MIFKIHENERAYYFSTIEEMNKHFNNADIMLEQQGDVIVISSKGSRWISNGLVAMTEEEVLKDLNDLANNSELLKI